RRPLRLALHDVPDLTGCHPRAADECFAASPIGDLSVNTFLGTCACQRHRRQAMKTSVLMLSAVMGLNGLAAFGQGYPSRPIRAVIPYAPGGVSDLVLRSLSDPLAQRLGQPVVIENRGGGGTVAAGQVARAAADGHLVMLGTGGNLAMAPSLYKSLPYDPQKDFAPIAMVARGQLALVVHPSVPASSVRELLNLARTRPGQLDYASSGVGSPLHLAMEL